MHQRLKLPGNRNTGMTLVELALALAILGVVAMLAIPSYMGYIDKANNTQAMADITSISLAIDRYQINHNDNLPDSLSDIGLGGKTDPWGNPYQFFNIANAKGNGGLRKDRNLVPINSDYDLYSKGKDGDSVGPLTAKKSQDDIVRANNGSFIGLASEY